MGIMLAYGLLDGSGRVKSGIIGREGLQWSELDGVVKTKPDLERQKIGQY